MTKSQIEKILELIYKMFPDARWELEYSTPFQLLVAVILSAQTTDKQVNKVTSTFFDKIKSPEDLVNYGLINFENAIKSIWLYKTKAKNVFNTSTMLFENFFVPQNAKEKAFFKKYWYLIPSDLKEFISLPWVWIKTAKILLNEFYDTEYIPVDTHIHRVSNRLWFVQTTSAEKTSELLEEIIPSKFKKKFHFHIIFFGRYFCKSRNPSCNVCPFTKICKEFKIFLKKNVE